MTKDMLKQFSHVVIVSESQKRLKRFHGSNATLCPIRLKKSGNSTHETGSITFKQLVHDYIYKNPSIPKTKNIVFINCDLKGVEEDILEDLLHFAYYNGCDIRITFHIDRWKTNKIGDFVYLFEHFDMDCPIDNLAKFIAENPSTPLLLKPRKTGKLLQKQSMPAVIIGYNQPTFIKNMVNQLEKYTSDIIVIDNNSTFQPLLDYYKNEFKYTLLKQEANYGHTVYTKNFIQKLVGNVYVLTDPDLQFNPKLPADFIDTLLSISNYFQAGRVGFALCIDFAEIRTDITYMGMSIKDWESQFWVYQLGFSDKPELELYAAPIDTTFCLINRAFEQGSIRVAGDYTCFHIPWHKNFQNQLPQDEYENYLENNISTNWFD